LAKLAKLREVGRPPFAVWEIFFFARKYTCRQDRFVPRRGALLAESAVFHSPVLVKTIAF
jgi:hypothetical protein